ncbi:helix-hairpin-helix domain-containing protein [Methanoculleus sp.]|uniref:helix-hairpin-helix domain-containing protein n=2 Tax=Methanoculleus sp. TaxID=90427 RepID=UPI0025F66921|nr:helix-hairpin-helix domain-containing protein [Methanoculleus sp.]MCK9319095.1 helix-hairpin-helix domain-containing protein [Methanoculleus sp.]MDD2254926.1 helix-hairpin-helix domain-containing protein [Methanoculleus sp.]MDD2788695.1 helix-hairpin-helix domain-containing protein [Methanoculleus sp.]MDD3217248.1 helix-hairpin-helix domain-containing protein [Methanoculleus sp.]MDD4315212.1 helix-hairpin-helix domain-containing protein [Methanoculleus sp.]
MMTPGKQVTNGDVAERLAFMSRLLEIAGADRYRVGAYERAARQIDRLSLPVAGLDEDELTRIPGIGLRLAGQIREILTTGSFAELDNLQAAIPGSIVELLGITGVGPRTLRTLWKKLGILTLDDLEQAVKSHRVRALPGFGAKKEEAIQRGIREFRRRPDRMTRPQADAVLESAKALFPDGRYTVAGSYRRGASTVGGIVVVATGDANAVMRRPGATGSAGVVSLPLDGAGLKIRFTEPARCGTALLCATGSRRFLARLRGVALEQGYRLEPDGLVDVSDGQVHAFKREEDVFAFLGMAAVPPELREDRGEIELALRHALPDLVDRSGVRGDLHAHTTFSDGRQSLEDVAAAGDARDYEYIVITDHSSKVRPEALAKQQAEIERVNRRHTCQLLAGSEVDIKSDGTLGYPDRVLADLDLVIASVHSGFGQDQDLLTRRVLTTMENEHVDIIGHPTGRLLGRRPPHAIDLARVVAHAAVTGTALEINASPHRLDLEDIYVWDAKRKGVKLAIGTDAHRAGEFSNMRYGIMLARRGWCIPDDIINTLSLSGLLEWRS